MVVGGWGKEAKFGEIERERRRSKIRKANGEWEELIEVNGEGEAK